MKGINKIQAATLFAYGYKLQDKEGVEWSIRSAFTMPVTKATFLEITTGVIIKCVDAAQLHDYYEILARPLSDLTQPITHDGKAFVPIVELGNTAFPYEYFEISEKKDKALSDKYEFCFSNLNNGFSVHNYMTDNYSMLPNQQRLFNLLYEWNFQCIEGIPQEFYINLNP